MQGIERGLPGRKSFGLIHVVFGKNLQPQPKSFRCNTDAGFEQRITLSKAAPLSWARYVRINCITLEETYSSQVFSSWVPQMSASESSARQGPGGDGCKGGGDNTHSRHPGSSSLGEQGSERAHRPREAPEPAKSSASSITQPAESENNLHPNGRPQQDETAANLGAHDLEIRADQEVDGRERDEDPLLDITMPRAPEPARIPQEYEDDGWEEVGSSSEEDSAADSDSEGDSHTSSESGSSDECEKKEATEGADGQEELPFGCSHYRRKCKVVAPCCGNVFWCRHCHNEAHESDLDKAHEIDRHAVEEVLCAACETRQPVSNKCVKCCTIFGKYYCPVCKFWDDQGEKKKVYHCDECGICRSGGRNNYFHCPTCGSCYPLQLQNKHKCLENAMQRQCPVCLEDMFSSLRQSQVLLCGHTIHSDCLRQLQRQKGLQAIRCPMCSKSIADYSEFWKQLSEEILHTPLEEQFRRKVRVVCNDCLERSTTDFHFIGNKCPKCSSFNTRDIANE